ncbi:MAG: hypothetical protein GY757_57360, partial [bacterium]|nr:hypothetical protein [bacterium]
LPFSDLGKREELFNKLNAIDGIAIPREKINKRPSFNLEVLLERKNRDAFKAIFEWVVKEINKDG